MSQRTSLYSRSPSINDTTELLQAWTRGEGAAREQLFTHLYRDIHALAARLRRQQGAGETLQTTALVHELYLRMVDQRRAQWEDRGQFFAIAARLLRRILVDQARARQSLKRGGDLQRVDGEELEVIVLPPDEQVLALDACLDELDQADPAAARLVELRYFAGMSLEQVADLLQTSRASVVREWRSVKAWLALRLA